MTYNFHKEFFLVRDEVDGITKLFHRWHSVVEFLTDDIMKNGYNIIFDGDENDYDFGEWREPKDREECFNLLFNLNNIQDLNDYLEDLYHTELIEFSD